MSVETMRMCDVQKCGKVAQHTLEYVTVGVRDINQKKKRYEDGLQIWTSVGVDLCGEHEYAYRTALPEIKLNQMREVKR